MIKRAYFSPCRKWRYTLHRIWDESIPYCQFIGLNPSTADEETNDPTVTRCETYARDWGYGGLVMTNLFAWRDTDPKGMKAQPDPVGGENVQAIVDTAKLAGIIVAAWGTDGAHHSNFGDHMRRLLAHRFADKLHVLRLTKHGHPHHPLYLPGDLKPFRWE